MKINSKKTYFNIEQFEILIDYIGLLQTREILSSWAGHKVARIALSDKKIINTVSILNKIGLKFKDLFKRNKRTTFDLLYNDASHLNYLLHNLLDFKEDWTKRVEQYKPIPVMNKFREVFLS